MTSPAPARGFFGYGCDAIAGVVSALILAYALKHPDLIFVLLAYISALPLFIVGLSAGFRSGLIASVCGVAAIFATGPTGIGGFYLIAYALPAALLVFFALRGKILPDGTFAYAPAGDLLLALAIYPCAIFLLINAQMAGQDSGLLGATQQAFDGIPSHISDMLAANGEKATPEQLVNIRHYLDFLARVAPGMIMCGWALSTSIVMGAAQALVRQQGRALRPDFALTGLRLPRWFGLLALNLIAGCYAPAPYNYLATNLAIICLLPFFFTGLAVIHARAALMRSPAFFLVPFYLAVIVVPWLALVVAIMGGADQWADFRKRFAEKASRLNTQKGDKND